MSLPVVLRAEAEQAFDWYEAQKAGLGVEFAEAVQVVYDRIAANPLIHQVVFSDIRRGLVRRFPYAILYRPHAERVEVVAGLPQPPRSFDLADTRLNPRTQRCCDLE
jgi:plasmid stabilization system protein ParE